MKLSDQHTDICFGFLWFAFWFWFSSRFENLKENDHPSEFFLKFYVIFETAEPTHGPCSLSDLLSVTRLTTWPIRSTNGSTVASKTATALLRLERFSFKSFSPTLLDVTRISYELSRWISCLFSLPRLIVIVVKPAETPCFVFPDCLVLPVCYANGVASSHLGTKRKSFIAAVHWRINWKRVAIPLC